MVEYQQVKAEFNNKEGKERSGQELIASATVNPAEAHSAGLSGVEMLKVRQTLATTLWASSLGEEGYLGIRSMLWS